MEIENDGPRGLGIQPPAGALTVSQGADGSMLAEFGQDVTASALQARETAMVMASFHRGLTHPRSWMKVRERAMLEAKNPAFAEESFYSFELGGEKIEGINIQGAQALRRLAGNMRCGAKVIFDGPRTVTYLVETIDFETGAIDSEEITVQKYVERRKLKKGEAAVATRTNHQGETLYIVAASDRDMWAAIHTALSRVKRNQILSFVPPDIRHEFLAICKASVEKESKSNPVKVRNAVFDAFAQQGVTGADLEKYLGHEANMMTEQEINHLRLLIGAIKQGVVKWADVLEAKETGKEIKLPEVKPKGAVPPPDPKAQTNGKPTGGPVSPRVEAAVAVVKEGGGDPSKPGQGRIVDESTTPDAPPATEATMHEQQSPPAGEEAKLEAEMERLAKGLEEAGAQGVEVVKAWGVTEKAALDKLPEGDRRRLRDRYGELKKK